MKTTDHLVVIQLAGLVKPGDALRLAQRIVEDYPDEVESATPAQGDGFGRTIYNLEQMQR